MLPGSIVSIWDKVPSAMCASIPGIVFCKNRIKDCAPIESVQSLRSHRRLQNSSPALLCTAPHGSLGGRTAFDLCGGATSKASSKTTKNGKSAGRLGFNISCTGALAVKSLRSPSVLKRAIRACVAGWSLSVLPCTAACMAEHVLHGKEASRAREQPTCGYEHLQL